MKVVGLLSGGIDSAVALHLMRERGAQVVPLYFDVEPSSEKPAFERVKKVARTLGFTEILVASHAPSMRAFREKADARFTCVFCKRVMMRVAGRVAREAGADALVTGDSLGQVASQTPENLLVETAVAEVPIIRPLIGMNKEEAVAVARRIGSFESSSENAGGCAFVPGKPCTAARVENMAEEEGKVELGALVDAEAASVRRVKA